MICCSRCGRHAPPPKYRHSCGCLRVCARFCSRATGATEGTHCWATIVPAWWLSSLCDRADRAGIPAAAAAAAAPFCSSRLNVQAPYTVRRTPQQHTHAQKRMCVEFVSPNSSMCQFAVCRCGGVVDVVDVCHNLFHKILFSNTKKRFNFEMYIQTRVTRDKWITQIHTCARTCYN